jgi:hypothetical protein
MRQTRISRAALGNVIAFACSTALTVMTGGCGSNERTSEDRTVAHALNAGAEFAVLRHRPSAQTADEVSYTARYLASVMLRKSVGPGRAGDVGEHIIGVALPEEPDFRIHYDADSDTLDVLDVRTDALRSGDVDVGPSGADRVFARVAQDLEAASLLSSAGLGEVEITRTICGEGASDEAPRTWVKDYRYFVPAKLEGSSVQRGVRPLGTTIAVHRSGALSAIRVHGLELVKKSAQSPALPITGKARRAVDKHNLDEKVRLDFPRAKAFSLGVRYLVDEAESSGLLTPREVYRIQGQGISEEEGEVVKPPPFWVAYNLSKPDEAPILWPKPNPDEKGDPR